MLFFKKFFEVWNFNKTKHSRTELLEILTNKNKSHLHTLALEQYVENARHIVEILAIALGHIKNVSSPTRFKTAYCVLDVINGTIEHISVGCCGKKAQLKKAEILADLFESFYESPTLRQDIVYVAYNKLGLDAQSVFHKRRQCIEKTRNQKTN